MSAGPRVAVVASGDPAARSGVMRNLGQTIAGLRALDHDVMRVLGDDSVPSGPDAEAAIATRLARQRADCDQAFRSWKPDAVHVELAAGMGHAALETATALGIPVTSTWHRLHHSAPAGEQDRALDALVAFHRRAARTFVEAEDDARLLASRGVPGVILLDRGVDSRLFAPDARTPELRRAWGAGKDDCVLLHVGRLLSLKNLDLLVRAAEAAHAAAPSARLVIVGDGPERERLRARLPWAVFTGTLGDDTLAEVYASADAFLFPSLADSFGNVVLEAMASGLGIVLFDRGAARQLSDGVSARCVPEGDEARYITATVELARDVALARRLGAAARESALELPADSAARAIAREVATLRR